MNIQEVHLAFTNKLTSRSKTTSIVIHHAAASKCTIEDIHRWHLANGWAGCGYHFLVRKDGSVWAGRPIDTVGAHAYGANSSSIGVCCEGDYTKEVMPTVQFDALAELVAYLMGKYDLTVDSVIRHSDVKGSATICPGDVFPWDGLKQRLGGKIETKPNTISVLEWQNAAIADGYKFPKYGADGKWGAECESVAKRAICKRYYLVYKNKNLVKIIQRAVGVEVDGKFGKQTEQVVRFWQSLVGLSVDGVVGINSWCKLLGIK